MSSAAPTAVASGLEFVPIEQVICMGCETEIRWPYIRKQVIRSKGVSDTRQRVTCVCPHCRSMWQAVRRMRGGILETESIVRIDDPARVAKFLAEIGPLLNERQIRQAC